MALKRDNWDRERQMKRSEADDVEQYFYSEDGKVGSLPRIQKHEYTNKSAIEENISWGGLGAKFVYSCSYSWMVCNSIFCFFVS